MFTECWRPDARKYTGRTRRTSRKTALARAGCVARMVLGLLEVTDGARRGLPAQVAGFGTEWHLPRGVVGMTTTRPPGLTFPGCATSTTSPAASWPNDCMAEPCSNAVDSLQKGANMILTTTNSPVASGARSFDNPGLARACDHGDLRLSSPLAMILSCPADISNVDPGPRSSRAFSSLLLRLLIDVRTNADIIQAYSQTIRRHGER